MFLAFQERRQRNIFWIIENIWAENFLWKWWTLNLDSSNFWMISRDQLMLLSRRLLQGKDLTIIWTKMGLVPVQIKPKLLRINGMKISLYQKVSSSIQRDLFVIRLCHVLKMTCFEFFISNLRLSFSYVLRMSSRISNSFRYSVYKISTPWYCIKQYLDKSSVCCWK